MMPPLRKITWLDPCSPEATAVHNIKELETVHRPLEVTTIGYVLKDDEKGVTLACEHCGGDDYRGLTFVLRVLIVRDESVGPSPRPRRPRTSPASPPTPPSSQTPA